jgi:hypothetical protein
MAKFMRDDNGALFFFTWECEDYIILDAWLNIIESGQSNHEKLGQFKRFFLGEIGGTLTVGMFQVMNNLLSSGKHCYDPLPKWVNSHSDEQNYCNTKGNAKYLWRKVKIEKLKAMDVGSRDAFIKSEREKAANLPEHDMPITTWDEVKKRPAVGNPLLVVEKNSRLTAFKTEQARLIKELKEKSKEIKVMGASQEDLMAEVRAARMEIRELKEILTKIFK